MNGDNDAAEHPAAHDDLHALVLNWAEATFNEPREQTVPMATTDAEEVIRSQLTEKTGTHFLDSGFSNGRHWQQNQDNPPWDDPRIEVYDSFVIKNVYHFMSERFQRDRTAVALEVCLWAMSDGLPQLGEMEEFAELRAHSPREVAEELDVPREIAEDAFGILSRERKDPPFTFNTYNQECGSLSQCLQTTVFGGPYGEYAMVQVHQGADVRGGYTAPRVYRNQYGGWLPAEHEFVCDRCEWIEYESCLFGSDELLYQPEIDPEELYETLRERNDVNTDEEIEGAVEAAIETAHDHDEYDGAVFHLGGGCGGHVRVN